MDDIRNSVNQMAQIFSQFGGDIEFFHKMLQESGKTEHKTIPKAPVIVDLWEVPTNHDNR